MDSFLERISAKIAELEAKLADLRIAERELLALEPAPARRTRPARGPKQKRKPKPNAPSPARQTIGAAITEVLGQHGALLVGEIAGHIQGAGRDINKRAISFALQALKKRGAVKNADGKWMLPKTRSKRVSS